jgi:hypothetical protein
LKPTYLAVSYSDLNHFGWLTLDFRRLFLTVGINLHTKRIVQQILMLNLRGFDMILRNWSKSISKLSIRIENTNRAIAEIDQLEDLRTLSLPEVNFRKFMKVHLARLLSYQNAYWKKRCTIRWTKFGDETSNFFRLLALRGTEETQ